MMQLVVDPIEAIYFTDYYGKYEDGDKILRSRKHLLINRRHIDRKRDSRAGHFELRLRINQRKSNVSTPTDDIAKKVDELWPEIEAGIKYLRDR